MSIKGNAEIIRDEVATDGNTAARIGSNLVEIADDLIDKNALIAANTLKVGYTDALVAAAPSVVTNGNNIAINTTNIANNATNIATNDTDIAANVANIAANTSGVASNLSSLNGKVNTSSIVNDLTTGGTTVPLSAEQGVALKTLITSGGVLPENNLTSTSTNLPLAANQGRVLKGLVDANTANITSNDTDIAANTANITTNANNIASNDTDIATNVTNIATNATNIATNTANITSNDTDIATNATNIATNTANITSNDTDIATNATNIATNTANITSNDTDIATNVTNIATNVTNIATNVTDIAINTSAISALGGAFTGGKWGGLDYQTVTSPGTGKVWLDRNLGATRVATSATDSSSFGWLFQWGRQTDGHQFRTSPTSSTQLHGWMVVSDNFIIATNWTSEMNYYLWEDNWEGKKLNSVCPPGFRLPTAAEWIAEKAHFSSQDTAGAYASFLKISMNAYRVYAGYISNTSEGFLWAKGQNYLNITSSAINGFSVGITGNAHGIRCIKD